MSIAADWLDDHAPAVELDAPEETGLAPVADDAVAAWLEQAVTPEDPVGYAETDAPEAEPDPVDELDPAEQKPHVVARLHALSDDLQPPADRAEFIEDFLGALQAHADHNTRYSQCRQGECGLGDRFGIDLGDETVRADCSGLIVGSALQAGLWIGPAAWWTGGMIERWGHLEVDLADRRAGDVVLNMAHAGVIDHDGDVIHASGSRGVVVDAWDGSWFEAQDDLRVYRIADLVEDDAPHVGPVLQVIRQAESGGDYDATVSVGAATWPEALKKVGVDGPLTSLTVGEVRAVQDAWLILQEQAGVPLRSSAVGAYQIISGTLQMLLDRGVVDADELFDEVAQDDLAVALLQARGLDAYLAGELDARAYAGNLSKEWAGLPGAATGRSYYDGDGVNAATVPVDDVLDALGRVEP